MTVAATQTADAGAAAGGAAAAPAAPAATANTNGVAAGPAWLPGADPDTTAYVTAKGWNDPAAAVTSYRNLEKLFGADRAGHTVQVPSEGSDEVTMNNFYTKIGRPAAMTPPCRNSGRSTNVIRARDSRDASASLSAPHAIPVRCAKW